MPEPTDGLPLARVREADAVIEGGGIQVLALAGAMAEFEDRGLKRWRSVAGIGAGSILAAFLRGHSATDALDRMTAMNWRALLDYGRGGPLAGGYWNFLRRGAVARGESLRAVVNELLYGERFASAAWASDASQFWLALIAYDYTHERLLMLPSDLRLYRHPGERDPIEPALTPIADAVRMAMAIRGLFPPVELVEVATNERSWIVDASPYSNFPVWIFDRPGDVQWPTFGFRVVRDLRLRNPHQVQGHGQQPQRPPDRQAAPARGFGWQSVLGPDPFQQTPLRFDPSEQSELTLLRACLVPVAGVEAAEFSATSFDHERLIDAGRAAARSFLDTFSIDDYVNAHRRHVRETTR